MLNRKGIIIDADELYTREHSPAEINAKRLDAWRHKVEVLTSIRNDRLIRRMSLAANQEGVPCPASTCSPSPAGSGPTR